MFSEAKVTDIYCMENDFYKEFAIQQEKQMVKVCFPNVCFITGLSLNGRKKTASKSSEK